ncbi:ABC transporter permease [Sediminivirga luteola]|uniref:Peptide ABC transporter permease n=1 Tax=Sediminivirga luteola TaxID=1774748 RepID=A0A8J2TY50_9MICO|nr:ABC transporter permease [Sediminivirga luteola]MCI2265828.1 ABC transporter permease [Sediminivirga luteola]GGA14301.1 peptide ABC transporter permease [Sediminivirga luteola]
MRRLDLAVLRRRPGASRDPLMVAAGIVLGLLCLLALVAALVPFAGSPTEISGPRLSPPSWEYPLGTDSLGRSLLPRLLEGIGVTLVVSATAVLITAVLSTAIGIVAGYAGGWLRETVMRVVDVLYAFPAIILAILVAAVLGAGRVATVSAIVLVTVPLMVRMIAAQAATVAHRDFVTSARISGVRLPVILYRHILSGVGGTLAVQGTYALSVGILVEGGLSFLGQGVQLPQSSLGLLVQEGAVYMVAAPWLLFAPAAVLVASILSITVIGDTLRDRLEPREVRSLA